MLRSGQSLGSFLLFLFLLPRLVLVAQANFTVPVATSYCVVATCYICIVAPFAKSALFTDMNGRLYHCHHSLLQNVIPSDLRSSGIPVRICCLCAFS